MRLRLLLGDLIQMGDFQMGDLIQMGWGRKEEHRQLVRMLVRARLPQERGSFHEERLRLMKLQMGSCLGKQSRSWHLFLLWSYWRFDALLFAIPVGD